MSLLGSNSCLKCVELAETLCRQELSRNYISNATFARRGSAERRPVLSRVGLPMYSPGMLRVTVTVDNI